MTEVAIIALVIGVVICLLGRSCYRALSGKGGGCGCGGGSFGNSFGCASSEFQASDRESTP